MKYTQTIIHGVWVLSLLILASCASNRKKANCTEIRYRLDHTQYTDDQRDWIEDEWKECMTEYDSLAKLDSVQFRGIYDQFKDSIQINGDTTKHKPAHHNSGAVMTVPGGTP